MALLVALFSEDESDEFICQQMNNKKLSKDSFKVVRSEREMWVVQETKGKLKEWPASDEDFQISPCAILLSATAKEHVFSTGFVWLWTHHLVTGRLLNTVHNAKLFFKAKKKRVVESGIVWDTQNLGRIMN